MMTWRLIVVVAVFSPWIWWPTAGNAADLHWQDIKVYQTTLFYPGIASWEFLLSDDHRLGARNIAKNQRACRDCHIDKKTGGLDVQGDKIASGALTMKKSQKRFEPDPMPGKAGFLPVKVQAAYDDEYFYIRLQWASVGTSWQNAKRSPDRVAIQINKSQGPFKRYGCFINCHNDLNSMPQSPPKTEVRKHPYYGGRNREDVRLYAYYTRKSGWAGMKSEAELKGLLKENGLTDIWEMEFIGNQAEVDDESVFDDRKTDSRMDIEGSGAWLNGQYVAVMKRKLKTNDPEDVQFANGDQITIGIAIHDNTASHRKHYVSFPVNLGVGSQGDIIAVKLK